MAMVTLSEAARLTGLGKTTLARAIKSGRLSATRTEFGSYAIDPAELHRVYPFPDLYGRRERECKGAGRRPGAAAIPARAACASGHHGAGNGGLHVWRPVLSAKVFQDASAPEGMRILYAFGGSADAP